MIYPLLIQILIISNFSDNMVLVNVDLNNAILDDVNFENDDPEIIIFVKRMAQRNRYKQHKTCKKNK